MVFVAGSVFGKTAGVYFQRAEDMSQPERRSSGNLDFHQYSACIQERLPLIPAGQIQIPVPPAKVSVEGNAKFLENRI